MGELSLVRPSTMHSSNAWHREVQRNVAGLCHVLGKRRVWLDPLPGTPTHGRGGFSIHGGWWRGSAGCIDLTSDMPSFVDAFLKYGKDIDVVVRY